MEILIQRDGSFVLVNGVAIEGVDLSDLDPDINVVRWHGDRGEIEYCCTVDPLAPWRENEPITDFAPFQIYLDRRRAKIDAMKAEHDAAIAGMGYGDFRRLEYPPTSEMVVALWEHLVEGRPSADAGVDALQQARQAVKTAYPKKDGGHREAYRARTGDDLEFADPDA